MSEIPDTWLNTNLKTVANLVTGNTPSTKSPEYYGGSVPFVKPGDLDSADPITVTEQQLTELGAQQSRLVRAGSTLVSCIGNLGKVGFAGVPLATNQQINSAEFHREIVDDRYGYYLCKTLKSWMERESSATTIAILNKGKFGEAPFPLAPLPEQKRIANKLDTVLTRVDAVNTRLARVAPLLKRLRQSVLAAATSGRLTEDWYEQNLDKSRAKFALGDLVVSIDQGWSPKCEANAAPPDKWSVMKTTAIQALHFYPEENKELPYDLNPRPHLALADGDVLITRAGPRSRAGITCIVRGDQPMLMLCDKAYRVRVDRSKIHPQMLNLLLNSPEVLDEIDGMKTGISESGVNLTQAKFRELALSVPHIAEQTEIVRRVETLFAFADRLEARLAQAQTAATRLTPALLAKAFRGELVPQDPNDEPAAELLRRLQAQRASAPKASAGRGRKAVVQSEG